MRIQHVVQSKVRAVLLASAAFGAAGLASSCESTSGAPIEPVILSFNYATVSPADPSALVDNVSSGSTDIGALLGSNACNFTADMANASSRININGTPGQSGFNISFTASSTSNLTTSNPNTCEAVRGYALAVGSPSSTLAVGGTTSATSFETTLAMPAGDEAFTTSGGFFEATLDSHRASTNYAVGTFRFVARGSGATVLIGEGAYATD